MEPGTDQLQHSSALGRSILVVASVLMATARREARACLSSIRSVSFKCRSGYGPVGAAFSIGETCQNFCNDVVGAAPSLLRHITGMDCKRPTLHEQYSLGCVRRIGSQSVVWGGGCFGEG